MKYKNHSNIKILIVFTLLITLSSCISTNKYNLALSEIDALKEDNMMKDHRLEGANDQWISMMDEKNRTIEAQRLQLDSLLAISDRQQSRLSEIDANMKRAFPSFTNDEISTFIDQGYVRLSLDHRVLFNRGENDLSERGVDVVQDIVRELEKSKSDIMVIGHTDSIPFHSTTKDNWQLSFDRAHAVMKVMKSSGLSTDRIIVAGRGMNDPFITNDHQIGRLLNRRIEIVLMPDLSHVETLLTEIDE